MKPRRLKIRRLDEVSLVDKPANPVALVALWKRAPEEKPVTEKPEDDTMITVGMLTKVLRALGIGSEMFEKRVKQMPNGKWMAMDEAGKELGMFDSEDKAREAAYKKSEDKSMSEKKEPQPETVSKAELEARLAEIQKAADERIAKAEADAKASAEKVEKMQEDNRVASFVKRAAEFKILPIKPADFGALLAKIAKALTEAEYAEVERVLAASNEAARVGKLTEELGSGAPEGSIAAKVQAEVQKAQKADPSLSEQAARGKVFKENPTLRRELEAEQAGR